MVEYDILEKLVDEYFPYDYYNPGQREAIIDVVNSFINGKRHVIIESPTGTGKSIIAITVSKVLKHLQHIITSSIVTVTKGLQDQILNDGFVNADLRSAVNYGCPYGKGNYGTSGCISSKKELGCTEECPYLTAKYDFTDSNLRSINTAMFINVSHETIGVLDQSLVVLDECHKVPTVLVDQASLEWSIESLKDLEPYGDKFKYEPIKNVYIKIIETINNNKKENNLFSFSNHKDLLPLIDKLNSFSVDLNEKLDILIKNEKDESKIETYLKILNVFRSISKVNGVVSSGADHFIVCESENDKVVLKPVFSNDVVDPFIYSKGAIFLHMSATICGYEEYAEQMNIDLNDCQYINVKNPIPVENRQIYFNPVIKMSGKIDQEKVDSITEFIDNLIDNYHAGENGIIHTVSFELAKRIKEHSKYTDNMFVMAGKERTKILELLSQQEKGYIILSPSVEEGFDFKNDMARWQVIAKVPYDYIKDPVVSLINEVFPHVYFRNAVLRIVQAAGRSTRGINDYSNVYVVDNSFENLYNFNRKLFPDYFQESVKKIDRI